MRMHVLIACHNRADLTVQSVTGFLASAQKAGIDLSFTVFDDGSTDGTAQRLSEIPTDITVLRGNGSAFWARSMSIAEKCVLNSMAPNSSDFLVWLNDDVRIDDDSVARLVESVNQNPECVVVGAVRAPGVDSVSYSGMRRSGVHPLRFRTLPAADASQDVDTFNGNLVVVPTSVALRLGGIDGEFSHGLADIDYGLRCGRMGIRVVQAAGTFGTCPRNPPHPTAAIRTEWARFVGPKGGGNYASLRRILRKSNRRSWLLYIAATYILWWARMICRSFAARNSVLRPQK